MTESIVPVPFLSIAQDLISLCRFLKFIFGFFIVGILIWMKLDGEFAISLFLSRLRRHRDSHSKPHSSRVFASYTPFVILIQQRQFHPYRLRCRLMSLLLSLAVPAKRLLARRVEHEYATYNHAGILQLLFPPALHLMA